MEVLCQSNHLTPPLISELFPFVAHWKCLLTERTVFLLRRLHAAGRFSGDCTLLCCCLASFVFSLTLRRTMSSLLSCGCGHFLLLSASPECKKRRAE